MKDVPNSGLNRLGFGQGQTWNWVNWHIQVSRSLIQTWFLLDFIYLFIFIFLHGSEL